jgi:hypothetical protein
LENECIDKQYGFDVKVEKSVDDLKTCNENWK